MAVIDSVKALIEAPSVCAEAKEAAEKYLPAVGTDEQKAAADYLVAEMKDDLVPLDDNIEFFATEQAAEIFGAEAAAGHLAHFKEIKEQGAVWCDCPACVAAKAILDNQAELY